jgi:tetratricopeptide (TPR) repeat protein
MTRPESYYYRGLAEFQLKKTQEAKASFQKVVELAPESAEGRDAKQMLEGIK